MWHEHCKTCLWNTSEHVYFFRFSFSILNKRKTKYKILPNILVGHKYVKTSSFHLRKITTGTISNISSFSSYVILELSKMSSYFKFD